MLGNPIPSSEIGATLSLLLPHFDRILLAAFVFVNALNPVVFLEWGIMNNLFRFKDSRYRHFKIQDIDILKLYLLKNKSPFGRLWK